MPTDHESNATSTSDLKQPDNISKTSDDHLRQLLSTAIAVDGNMPTGRAIERFTRSTAVKR